MTIILPPELQQALEEQAEQQGTTPELLAIDRLRSLLLPPVVPNSPEGEGTMADFFADFIGSIHSSQVVPGGVHLSEDTGRRFKELLQKKQRADSSSC
jgi:hypothetical protein